MGGFFVFTPYLPEETNDEVHKMKRQIFFFALVILLFAGCNAGTNLKPIWQAYHWDNVFTVITYFSDSNPSTPTLVYRGEYFPSEEGSHSVYYEITDLRYGSTSWTLDYSIEGTLEWEVFVDITLGYDGPTITIIDSRITAEPAPNISALYERRNLEPVGPSFLENSPMVTTGIQGDNQTLQGAIQTDELTLLWTATRI